MKNRLLAALLTTLIGIVTVSAFGQWRDNPQFVSSEERMLKDATDARAKALREAWPRERGSAPDADTIAKILLANSTIKLIAAPRISESDLAFKLYESGEIKGGSSAMREFAEKLKRLKEICPLCDVAAPGTLPPGCPKK